MSGDAGERPMNIMWIISDDLRDMTTEPQLAGVFPNLEALAASGTHFTSAMVTQPHCGPSRQSFLTGRYPHRVDTLQKGRTAAGYYIHVKGPSNELKTVPGKSFVDWARAHGYRAYGVSKVSHTWEVSRRIFNRYKRGSYNPSVRTGTEVIAPSFTKWSKLGDGRAAKAAVRYLEDHVANHGEDTPFLLVLGLRRPHVNWEFHDHVSSEIPPDNEWVNDMSELDRIPQSPFAYSRLDKPLLKMEKVFKWDKKKNKALMCQEDVPLPGESPSEAYKETVKKLRVGYLRAVKSVDRNVAHMMSTLSRLQLENSTVVVFHSDHGYDLLNSGRSLKMKLSEMSVRVPLIIKVPGRPPSVHSDVYSIVNLGRDVLAAATRQDPAQVFQSHFSGLLPEPVALTFQPNCEESADNPVNTMCTPRQWPDYSSIGVSLRTNAYRYTRFYRYDAERTGGSGGLLWHEPVIAEELYDVEADPFCREQLLWDADLGPSGGQRPDDFMADVRDKLRFYMFVEASVCANYLEPTCAGLVDAGQCQWSPSDAKCLDFSHQFGSVAAAAALVEAEAEAEHGARRLQRELAESHMASLSLVVGLLLMATLLLRSRKTLHRNS